MVKKVLKMPNDKLREVSKNVTTYDASLRKLIQDLKDTHMSLQGLGLAAPQINERRRVILIAAPNKKIQILINPEIIEKIEEQKSHEGCFSVPGVKGYVKRAQQITVRYNMIDGLERTAILTDDEARIAQHEIDHLDGVVFTDHMENE